MNEGEAAEAAEGSVGAEGVEVPQAAEAAEGSEGAEGFEGASTAEAAEGVEGSESVQDATPFKKRKTYRWWSSGSPRHVSRAPASEVGTNWLSHAGAEPLELPG